jgi:hypothetical protein
MESTAHRLRCQLEARGEYVVTANTRWFAVFLHTWLDRLERAQRDGRKGPNLVVYKTKSNDPRDHYVIPYAVIRDLLVNDTITNSEVNGSQRWNLTLENDKLHVSHRASKVDVSKTHGALLLLEEAESPPGLTARIVETHFPVTRIGTTELRPETGYLRSGCDEREVDPIHNKLQNCLFQSLCDKFGIDAVVLEEGFADIKLRLPNGRIDLFEVKPDERPRIAIRAAIGQLLEYGYAVTQQGQQLRSLVVAAPGALNDADAKFLKYLQGLLKIELNYIQIHPDVCAVEGYVDLMSRPGC